MPRLPVIVFTLFVGLVVVIQAYGPWLEGGIILVDDGLGFDDRGVSMIGTRVKGTFPETWSTKPVQWSKADGGNGHWYMTMRDVRTRLVPWTDARDRCEAMGGHLACVTEASETAFLVRALAHRHQRAIGRGTFGWIGVTMDANDQPAWITGEPWGYTNWQRNRRRPVPSGDGPHVVMCGHDGPRSEAMGSWKDRGGPDGRFPMMNCWTIEWSADCNGDGIVDYGQILEGLFADGDGNGVPDCHEAGCACLPGKPDVNGDGKVDLHDFHVVIDGMGDWQQGDADVNCDGKVDAEDILGVLYQLGTSR